MNVQSKMARGAVWMILFKWVERGLGFISTLILVRLLSPEDFGIVAMALSFIFMTELLTAFAFDIALIHDQNATVDHYNSAWTANLILGGIVAVTMVAASHPISIFYNQPELTVLICVLAMGPLAVGFENIGIVAFRKELDFRKEFIFQVSRKVISFSVAIPLAFMLRSYWALVFGILASKIAGTLLSYWIHPFRPKISFKELRSLVRFSRWLLINNVVNFLKERLTDFFIGRVQGPGALGIYNISYEFSNLSTNEIGAPINRALLPGFAKLAGQPAEVRSSFVGALGLVAIISLPISFGLFAVAPVMVPVVFGKDWLAAIPVMEILSLNSAVLVFQGTIVTMFIAIGKPFSATKTNMFFVVTLVVGLVFLTGPLGSVGAAWSACAACLISMPVYLYQCRQFIKLRFSEMSTAVFRPLAAATLMALVVRLLQSDFRVDTGVIEGIAQLMRSVVVGALVYPVVLIALWFIMGRPKGAEEQVWSRARPRLESVAWSIFRKREL